MSNGIKQTSTLTSGTVTIPDTQQDCVLFHNAASLAATLTITLPATPVDAQRVSFVSTLGVTILTISSGLTIIGALTALAAAGYATYIYESSTNKWYRLS